MFEKEITWFFASPVLWLALTLVPLFWSAWKKRIFPSRLLLVLLTLPAILSLLIAFEPVFIKVLSTKQAFWTVLLLVFVDLGIIGIAVADWLFIPGQKRFQAERTAMKIASIEQKHAVSLSISNLGRSSFSIDIRDDLPEAFVPSKEQFSMRLKGKSRATSRYTFVSNKRGKFLLEVVYLRVRSRLRLWNAFYKIPAETEINVFPDLKQISEFEILARTNRLSLFGVRKTRKIGQDHDFERLRDYNQDDNYKNIDWRTTARRQKLTVKDFQSSQSQRVIFLVDCGRMMTNRAGDISLLDHSLNAMLMMSYVALRRGDAVGLITFSDRIHNFVPAKTGKNHMNVLLHASFDRHPQMVESRFDEAFLYLRTKCLKRSLVVVLTNLIDEVNANQVQVYLSSLVGRHLPLGVLLRDHQIFDALDAAHEPMPNNDLSLYRAAAAADVISWRQQVLSDLQHQGVLSLDCFPEDLTASLVNRYLEIKARHLL